ncbi:MAG: DNA-directed RNA polymerase subunit omega [delta proteobacterium ML8_D]|jgi:DNA-directed RNA polymerase subunit omega|nr:MAG: DNA-directed RNA polymerase subunit omega [delta proteobacterium ML8_D]
MARITIEDCLENLPNRFALVHLAIERVKQLRKGAQPLVKCKNREIVLALREIAQDKVKFENLEELAREAEEERIFQALQTDINQAEG